MKRQTARFETSEGSSLRISLSKSRSGGFKTMVRHRDAQEGRARIGMKNWFEPNQEAEAQSSFDELVKAAEAKGWPRIQQTRKQKMAFTELPFAPSADVAADLKATLKSVQKAAKR